MNFTDIVIILFIVFFIGFLIYLVHLINTVHKDIKKHIRREERGNLTDPGKGTYSERIRIKETA